ncbi:MAG: hypothetical protein JSR33_13110 [Proteobacteria bacterium]|nr:hypothetical protein [Pseudomonadota bacterium]
MFNIKKKNLNFALGIILTAWSTCSWATGQYVYFGIMPTFSVTNLNWQIVNVSDQDQNDLPGAGETLLDGSTSNTQLGLFTGYGVLLKKFYLGVEGGMEFGRREAQSNGSDLITEEHLTNQVTMSDIFLVDFRPGYVLTDKNTMLYGIVGLNLPRFRATQVTDDGELIQDSGYVRKNGYRLGLGYNLGLGRYFMGRIEYVFTKFPDFQFTDTFDNGDCSETSRLKVYSNEINLGLSFVVNI